MNWIIFLAIISALSAVHCLNEKTVGKLRDSLAPLKEQLDQALTGYRKHKYTVFQHAAQQFEISKQMMDLPKDETFNEDENTKMVFYKLTLYQFVYPVMSDPIRLSDALKVNAMSALLMRRNITLLSPEVADLKQSIRQIIAEEKRVDYNFNQANLILDDLYYDLHNVHVELFSLTSGFVEYSKSTLKQYCAEIATNCRPEMSEIADKIITTLTALRKLLPINTPEKVESVAELISGYVQLEATLSRFMEAEKIECFAVKCERQQDSHFHLEPKPEAVPKETLPELFQELYPLGKKLDSAISGYKHHKYAVFARTGNQFVFTKSLIQRIGRLPGNSTIEDSAEAKDLFTELVVYKYLYPVLADPVQLSDALKVNALIAGLDKMSNNPFLLISESTPSFEEAKETIRKIIFEETKINHNFNQTNLVLDDLYDDLGKPTYVFPLMTHGYVKRQMNLLENYCVKNSCTFSLVNVLTKFKVFDRIINRAHPIDSDKKLNTVANVLKKYWEHKIQLQKLTEAEHIRCDVFKCFKIIET